MKQELSHNVERLSLSSLDTAGIVRPAIPHLNLAIQECSQTFIDHSPQLASEHQGSTSNNNNESRFDHLVFLRLLIPKKKKKNPGMACGLKNVFRARSNSLGSLQSQRHAGRVCRGFHVPLGQEMLAMPTLLQLCCRLYSMR